MQCATPIIVAIDCADLSSAVALANQLDPKLCRVKVGKELFTACGPRIIEVLQGMNFDVFLDLKFHDIPHTTAMAIKVAASLNVWMVDIHCSGGLTMMQACRDVLDQSTSPTLLIGVTVLTSFSDEDLKQLHIKHNSAQQVLALAKLAEQAGLDGLVCSAQEAIALKSAFPRLSLVTPGIRPEGSCHDDQQRIVTPRQAIQNGSDYLVIGRPITKAESPSQALNAIVDSLYL